MEERKQECKQEPNWTELLEKEWATDPVYGSLVKGMRADGHPDKEIYQLLDTWG